MALQELAHIGVSNVITFDAHDPRVQNAIPLIGFDNVQPKYQMIKALMNTVEGVKLDRDNVTIISPDEGGMSRCIYYSSVLGLDLGMFYKRRDYSKIVKGRNPIISHEYLGGDIEGKDVIIVDDIISSGDSVIDIAEQLKAKKVRRVFVFASFGLFTDGLGRFDDAYKNHLFEKIFTTNLVYRPDGLNTREWYAEVDMSKYIAYIINTLNYDRSMSDLLDPVKRINKLLGKENN
jgi:ribose-phosphate pyrophosphokinase